MKKFDDILRLLSSILLGALIKDFDNVSHKLACLLHFHKTETAVAEQLADLTTVVLICVFLRNLHGSARYDELIKERNYHPSYEAHPLGRLTSFVLAVSGLFLGPLFVGHRLAYHLPESYSLMWLAIILFSPFAAYAVWDILIWLSEPEVSSDMASPRVEAIAHNWIKADAVVLVSGMAMLLYWIYLKGNKQEFDPSYLAIVFIVVAIAVIIFDYSRNLHFYFPTPASRKSRKRRDKD